MIKHMPFLLQFGESISERCGPPNAYDRERQVSRVFVNGQWIDAVDYPEDPFAGSTKKTGVGRETTDDD